MHLVENDVRGRLCGEGFTEEQILTWVESYFDSHSEGSADEVIEWIKRQERKTA